MGDRSANSEPVLTREQARASALEAGFQEAGLVALPYEAEERDAARFREWVAAGRAGTMGYLTRRSEDGQLLRERAGIPFPWARSALVCFASYASPSAPLSTKTPERASAWIARYAWTSRVLPSRVLPSRLLPDRSLPSRVDATGERRPSDYHKVLLKRMRAIEARLHEQLGEFESRAFVDTGPIVERALATAAGLGWTGKNTCMINQELGSFGFLAVLLTSVEVGPEDKRAELVPDRCGSCTRCIESCPTNALDSSLPDGCVTLHLVFDYRAQGSDRGGTRRKNGPAGLRLRHLPGRVPVEWEGDSRCVVYVPSHTFRKIGRSRCFDFAQDGKDGAQSDCGGRRACAARGTRQPSTGVVGLSGRAVL